MRCEWIRVERYKLQPYITASPLTVTANNEEKCRNQCLQQTWFLCAAYNYRATSSSNNCELLAENNQTASVVSFNEWVYSARPICAGKYPTLHQLAYKMLFIKINRLPFSIFLLLSLLHNSAVVNVVGDSICHIFAI